MQFCSRFLLLFSLALLGFNSQALAAVTPEQRAKVQQMSELMREAGELYAAHSYSDSASKITEIQEQLTELMQDGGEDPTLQRLVRPLYRRLSNAHSMLELEGAKLQPLPPWQDLVVGRPASDLADEPAKSMGTSFQRDIAPWFVSACGNCHINNRRGQFSMVSYEDLMKGPPEGKVLFPGSESGNRLVEVIESGDMPRGGGRVTPEQLAALKKWIAEGASFDGADPAAALTSYVERSQPNNPPRLTTSVATGSERVSFARDIAPILTKNCNGCHINGRQASGNLQMDNFEQLLRGGDSGNVFVRNDPTNSLIVKKLRGTAGGQRMPVGRPALTDETIELIETWIREGATFDGPSPETNVQVVANQAWAAAATHSELFARREGQASQNWSRALPTAKPTVVKSEQLLVMGNASPGRLETVTDSFKKALQKVQKQFGAPEDHPLIRGGLAVFVFKNRYDYSEFGRMIETRELPKDWLGHWHADPLDVYVVLNGGDELTEELLDSVTLQVTGGAYLASLGDVPFWFAEGAARNVVMTHHRRDPRVKRWQASLPAAGQQVENAQALLTGRLDEEAAGTVGMALTNFMMDRSNRRRFERLIDLLQEGKAFDDALTFTYAPPEALVKTWLGR